MTGPAGIDRLTDVKELLKVDRQIAKLLMILDKLEGRRAELLTALQEKG